MGISCLKFFCLQKTLSNRQIYRKKQPLKEFFRLTKNIFKKRLTKGVYQAYNTVKEQSVLMH